ncbi:MAG TPA: glycosidase [Ignavibacteriales bacterium]|nr:glycosidase [Ignavibacteriales bacterium]
MKSAAINKPRLLEINARLWIKRFGKNYNLSLVPDDQITRWKNLGFDMIWLMGVWDNNKDVISEYCFEPELISSYNNALKDWHKDDVIGSPYSINKYQINPILGTKEDLLSFKKKLNDAGIKLILDFICNHFSAKSSLIWTNKEIFLYADEYIFKNDPYTFYPSPANNKEYLAHGRDPLFPPWKDTAQINFYSQEARNYLTSVLIELTDLCDGVRCDMAMLPLNNIFYNTWIGVLKKYGFEKPEKEFWEEAISSVKNKRNDFIFIAETYWDLEWQLQNLGFDFTYDKRLTDRLVGGDIRSIKDHLDADLSYQAKSVRFLENHDEDRAITKLGRERSMAAAVITSTIPGVAFYFDGQCDGKKIKLPVQLGREPEEKQDEKIKEFYRNLFSIIKDDVFKNGNWKLLEASPVAESDHSYENILAWEWRLGKDLRVIIVNYNNSTSRCRLRFNVKAKSEEVVLNDLLNHTNYKRSIKEIADKGLFVELKSFNSHIFSFNE